MIRLHRPDPPPEFQDGGSSKVAQTQMCQLHAQNGVPDEIEFGDRHWMCAAESLKAAQHGKCCYCEGPLDAQSIAEVEHFRPKNQRRTKRNGPDVRRGYWWLAYDWKNLMMACGACNRYKSDQFPLSEDSIRAHTPEDDIGLEYPLLVDPFRENPADYLEFDGESIKAREGSRKGETTIRVLRLDRAGLKKQRLQEWQTLEGTRRIANHPLVNDELRADIIRQVRENLSEEHPFSAMISAYVVRHFSD